MVEGSRITGLLVGAAVGDALGAPFEFKPAGTYRMRFPSRVLGGIGELIGGGGFNWAPGEFTDDTQMAVVLAESLLANDLTLDRDHLFASWRQWATNATDIGSTTRHALSFERWQDVSHRNPEMTAANGALMRAFPLALLKVNDLTRREWTLQQAALTHAHPGYITAIHGAFQGEPEIHMKTDWKQRSAKVERKLESRLNMSRHISHTLTITEHGVTKQ